ncbi:hypothetical protein [Baaleninema simplex]|uniref:hypothetical protein n=1 Tax=Baaleninema simplex TaxID=2862350 RepID=UPI000345ABFE|nr:hypothetical protein [Baaleninema simplex]
MARFCKVSAAEEGQRVGLRRLLFLTQCNNFDRSYRGVAVGDFGQSAARSLVWGSDRAVFQLRLGCGEWEGMEDSASCKG